MYWCSIVHIFWLYKHPSPILVKIIDIPLKIVNFKMKQVSTETRYYTTITWWENSYIGISTIILLNTKVDILPQNYAV